MKIRQQSQEGFGAIGVLMAVVFVAVVGFAGYKIMNMHSGSVNTPTAKSESAGVPQSIKTKADLTQTNHALDNSSSQVDNNLNDVAIDADLNSML